MIFFHMKLHNETELKQKGLIYGTMDYITEVVYEEYDRYGIGRIRYRFAGFC